MRPDGYVAWRQLDDVSDRATARQMLRSALESVLGRV
ncbi:hypothetical protein [Paraburkholderia sp.]